MPAAQGASFFADALRATGATGAIDAPGVPGASGVPAESVPRAAYSFRVEWAGLSLGQAAALTPPFSPSSGVSGSPTIIPVAVLWLMPAEGYHTYANMPGGDALPTRAALAGAPAAAQARYLAGESQADVFEPSVTVRAYEGPTPIFLLFDGHVPAQDSVALSLLACSAKNCVPMKAFIPLGELPASLPAAEAQPWFAQLTAARPDGKSAGDAGINNSAAQGAPPAGLPGSTATRIQSPTGGSIQAEERIQSQTGVWKFSPVPFRPAREVQGLFKALALGLLAGLILNVMPCVLPVLTFKASAVLMGGGDLAERRKAFREQNLLFSAGILTWFAALALLFGVAGLAWGQLFQSPGAVFALLLLVFSLGLSMFGVFHLPVLDLRVGATSSPRLQAYSTGLMATLLATPCSGPLLGGVLSWSLLQPLPVLLMVFLATGLGMALPYLLMAWKPALANRLPRQGAWMLHMERLLGFFLMGTVVYLLSILPASLLMPSLIVLLVAAAAAWIWGTWGSLRASGLKKIAIGGAGLAAVAFSIYLAFSPSPPGTDWRPFRAEEFRAGLGRKPLLLEFTAAWCPTCKVLEHTALSSDNLEPLVRQYGLTLIRVDMTSYDAETHALLRSLGGASIPFLAVFPAGDKAGNPVVLRDLYTTGQLRGALRQALEALAP